MPIDAKCPFCEKGYRLKDDLVGKKVTCANQDCRKVFTVAPSANGTHPPKPAAPPKPAPARPPVDAEELAAAALNDDPDEVPEEQKTIAMTCSICEHKWPVAWAMQGKNVLCPDCKHRQKVPVQEKGKKGGWRERNEPEGVKRDKLDDVMSARDNSMVSGSTLLETGAVKIDYEPLPTSIYVKWAAIIGIPFLLLVGAGFYWMKSRTDRHEEQVVAEYDKVLESDDMKALPLYQAALRIALGEYEARKNDPEQRSKAVEYFSGALANLGSAPRTPDREHLYGELALALLHLGGEGQDVTDKRKLSWLPPQQTAAAGAKVKPNPAELEGVQGQLRRVLNGLKETRADFHVRAAVLRRLTRELLKVNQLEVVRSTLPALFDADEQWEAEGQIALECFRAGQKDRADEVANKMRAAFTAAQPPKADPPIASVQALWILLDTKGVPTLVPAPSAADIPDATRWAYTAVNVLKNNPSEARSIANRAGKTEAKIRALALAAEWSDKPGEFLDSAEAAVKDEVRKRDPNVVLSPGILLRLAQMSARAGAADKAEEFVKPIFDEHMKPFVKAEILRHKLAADRGQQPKDEDAELPAEIDVKKLKLGHAWGRYHLARHNGIRTNDKGLANAYAKNWPRNVIAPFGQIGVTLGVQDNEKK
jgi:hypothetical protein